jgi:3-oxoacyl-[acyl-carrier protein] reductase
METGLSGFAVAITGASGGIGESLVDAFGAEGCALALHARTRGHELASLVARKGLAARSLCQQADLRSEAEVERAFDAWTARFGRVDVCVANAGIWPADSEPLQRMAPARVREVIEVNLLGALWTARAFLRALERTGPRPDGHGASLLLIGSTAGRFGEAGHVEYAASKAALHGVVRSLKNEIVHLDPAARVNLVEPGWTRTPMAEASLAERDVVERVMSTRPLRQLAEPRDVARICVALASPLIARHVSGEVVTVAGGMEGRLLW